jgi:hypothetical protein
LSPAEGILETALDVVPLAELAQYVRFGRPQLLQPDGKIVGARIANLGERAQRRLPGTLGCVAVASCQLGLSNVDQSFGLVGAITQLPADVEGVV